MFISQDLFDETLVESQELFEYSDEKAVQETISELESGDSAVRLDHLSLTHPNSPEGQQGRQTQNKFCQAVSDEQLSAATELLTNADNKKSLPTYASLVLQHGYLASDSALWNYFEKEDEVDVEGFLQFLLAVLPPDVTTIHPLAQALKLQMAQALQEQWCTLYEKYQGKLRILLVQWARSCCNACESNKKTFVQAAIRYKYQYGDDKKANGLNLLVDSLPMDIHDDASNKLLAKELCKLVSVINKYQANAEAPPKDGDAPLVSSAHANVKELHKCGAATRLLGLAKQCSNGGDDEDLLCETLSALRVMAIDNDIVQTMTGLGILETANASLLAQSTPELAAATLGLLRNLSANDEIKTSICKQSLSNILHAMETHSNHVAVQEHGCGILSAMALRQPNNAMAICEANGTHFILVAMRAFPNKVPLQRQGCLALRNIASRLSPESKQIVLDAGAENVLRGMASQHQGSIEEAYAALRDLGLPSVMYMVDENGKTQGTQVFGTVKSNFRSVYD
jgi:hypothetical protein